MHAKYTYVHVAQWYNSIAQFFIKFNANSALFDKRMDTKFSFFEYLFSIIIFCIRDHNLTINAGLRNNDWHRVSSS